MARCQAWRWLMPGGSPLQDNTLLASRNAPVACDLRPSAMDVGLFLRWPVASGLPGMRADASEYGQDFLLGGSRLPKGLQAIRELNAPGLGGMPDICN